MQFVKFATLMWVLATFLTGVFLLFASQPAPSPDLTLAAVGVHAFASIAFALCCMSGLFVLAVWVALACWRITKPRSRLVQPEELRPVAPHARPRASNHAGSRWLGGLDE